MGFNRWGCTCAAYAWNFFTATTVNTMNTTITVTCATKNGGSDPVGANACNAGDFINACAIKTNTLKYSEMHALITYPRRQSPAIFFEYRATSATASAISESAPIICEGNNLCAGRMNPVKLVNTVVDKNSAVIPSIRLAENIPNKTTNPVAIPTKLNSTCTNTIGLIPRIMGRFPPSRGQL